MVLLQGMMAMGAMVSISVLVGCVSPAIMFQANHATSTAFIRTAVESYHLNKIYSQGIDILQTEVSSATYFLNFDFCFENDYIATSTKHENTGGRRQE